MVAKYSGLLSVPPVPNGAMKVIWVGETLISGAGLLFTVTVTPPNNGRNGGDRTWPGGGKKSVANPEPWSVIISPGAIGLVTGAWLAEFETLCGSTKIPVPAYGWDCNRIKSV